MSLHCLENYFGDYYTSPRQQYKVTNGLFANWPIPVFKDEIHGKRSSMNVNKCIAQEHYKPRPCDPSNPNSPRLIRQHEDCTPVLTRNPLDPTYNNAAGFLGGTSEIVYGERDFEACIGRDVRSFLEWMNCIEAYNIECTRRRDTAMTNEKLRPLLDLANRKAPPAAAHALQDTVARMNDPTLRQQGGFCDTTMLHGRKKGFGYDPIMLHGQIHLKFGTSIWLFLSVLKANACLCVLTSCGCLEPFRVQD